MIPKRRRLLIDVSYINHIDQGSGIQRVVRNISKTLYQMQGTIEFEVALVTLHGQHLAYAERITQQLQLPNDRTGAIDIEDQDILLMLDSSWHLTDHFIPLFKTLHERNGTIITVVYDTIPIDYPQYCATDTLQVFGRWLFLSHQYTDHYLCISKDVATRLKNIIDMNHWRFRDLSIGYFHLGSELDAAPVQPLNTHPLPYNPDLPLFLVVSTVEPRKGHAVLLDAFEQLWQQGYAIQLCFIGKQGWFMDEFSARVKTHPELNKRFFWGIVVDDQALTASYQMASALLFASVIEGYGLGIVEAAKHNVPILCSDIPVFREITQGGAVLVEQANPDAWASAVKQLLNKELVFNNSNINALTWQDSAAQVLDFIKHPLGAQMVYSA